jgi:hypothetical protein
MRDAAAAYQQALLWRITGDDSYAASAANILNQWTNVCKVVTSNDANHVLAAGAQGYTFAMAAEMLSGYSGWSESQRATTKNWLIDVFASVNRDFLDYHAHTADGAEHYWSNWDLVTLCSYMAIGIFAENNDMINFVINYFYSGAGNGCIYKLTRGTHTDPLGTGEILCQNQESGRDQGHAQMSMAVAAQLCQMAYSLYQSNRAVGQLDFFSADNNAILHMAEYVALGNLRDGTDNKNASGAWLINAARMPFTEYVYAKGYSWGAVHTQMTDDEGRGNPRPGWEIIYQHYRHSGSGLVYSQKFADKLRPEGGAGEPANRYGSNSGTFDQLGWNTLMLYQE